MISYDFYLRKVNEIISLLRKGETKIAAFKYFLFKENFQSNLLSFLFFIKNLEDNNKLSKDLRLLIINHVLGPFISDWEAVFQDSKKVINDHIPFIRESKIKEIIKNLQLKKEKEIIFFNSCLNIISDIECYLEGISTKDIDQIILEATEINIGKFPMISKQELFHFYSKPRESIDEFLIKNNLNKEEYDKIKTRIRSLRIDQICALIKIMGVDFDRSDFERIAYLLKNKNHSFLDDIIIEADSLAELKWWLEFFEKFNS